MVTSSRCLLACAGLDAVVVLELDDEALAVKRALGRRVDPLTGRVYHLEFDVPPPKEPGLAARLKVGMRLFCSLLPLMGSLAALCPALLDSLSWYHLLCWATVYSV